MKKLFTLFAIAALVCVGCSDDYDDSGLQYRVGSLESRVAKLEELCKQMNTNISALQTIVTALQNNDYVTSVIPVSKDGETIGYTITFTKSAPITIYHGQDGKDGANGADGKDGVNGKDGHTPVIGVRQDTDGVYYWTLDGDWLLDNSGNKIKAEGRDGKDGQNGADGKDGQDGKDGKDGITPQLKIEGGYWYVSTDNGATWTNLGKATGEDGKDGDPMFKSVTQDEENVYFTLQATDEVIAVPKKQKLQINFDVTGDLLFDYNETKTIQYTITGHSDKCIVKAEMMNLDNNYSLHTTPISATTGSIEITASLFNYTAENQIIITVSDGSQTVMNAIAVRSKPLIEKLTVTAVEPGTLSSLLSDYNTYDINTLTISGNLNSNDILTLDNLPSLQTLDMGNANLEHEQDLQFEYNRSLKTVILPKTLTTIRDGAFRQCRELRTIILPKTLTAIGDSAFSECSLQSIDFPESLLSIGSYAICGLFIDISLNEGLISIGDHAFSGCPYLKRVVLPESLTSVGNRLFTDRNDFQANIYCKAKNPPSVLESNVTVRLNISKCMLYVPKNCKDAYVNSPWGEAKGIEETDF